MIVLNEKEYAIRCLENGYVGSKPFFTLSIIAKYYYYCLKYKKSKIEMLLNDFMSKNYSVGYQADRLSWQDTIEKIVKKVNNYTLLELDGVRITKSELKIISGIGNPNKERVMFTILCLAKFGLARNPNSNGWVNIDSKEIFKMARVSCKALERELYIGDLFDMDLLELPMRNDNTSIRVTFIDTDSPEELFISDFRELGYEYLKYKGENFIRCAECGILTRGNKNGTKKYCKDCAAYTPQKSKTIICVDCGKEVIVSGSSKKIVRCSECQSKRNKSKMAAFRYNQYYQNNILNQAQKISLRHFKTKGFDARDYAPGGKYYKEIPVEEIIRGIIESINKIEKEIQDVAQMTLNQIQQFLEIIFSVHQIDYSKTEKKIVELKELSDLLHSNFNDL